MLSNTLANDVTCHTMTSNLSKEMNENEFRFLFVSTCYILKEGVIQTNTF